MPHVTVQVPVAIGGPGLPKEAKMRQDLPDAGLTNVTGAIMNLLGFQACMLLPCCARRRSCRWLASVVCGGLLAATAGVCLLRMAA